MAAKSALIVVYTTFADAKSAKKAILTLLDEKLIACATMFPTTSFYSWKGKNEQAREIIVLAKTRPALWTSARDRLREVHSYDTPMIIKLAGESNTAYATWVTKQTR